MCKRCTIAEGPEMYFARPHGELLMVAAYGLAPAPAYDEDGQPPS